MEKMMLVEAIEHKDVRGKTQYYVKISGDGAEHIISSGVSTVERIKAMMQGTTNKSMKNELKPEEDQLPFGDGKGPIHGSYPVPGPEVTIQHGQAKGKK